VVTVKRSDGEARRKTFYCIRGAGAR